jgi:hypothetical protein
MANTKISQLPSYTGTAADLRWFVMNNSGETETFKYSGYTSGVRPVSGVTSSFMSINYTDSNVACNYSLLLGGENNSMAANYFVGRNTIIGGNDNTIPAGFNNMILNGSAASIVGNAATIIGASGSITDGFGNILLGGSGQVGSNNSGIVAGGGNIIGPTYNDRCFIGGGENNYITYGSNNSIIAGKTNLIEGNSNNGAIAGGESNKLTASNHGFIGGGKLNIITSTNQYNSICGGSQNQIVDSQLNSGIFNSFNSYISGLGSYNTLLGGSTNALVNNSSSVIIGGSNCLISGNTSPSVNSYNSIIASRSSTIPNGLNHVSMIGTLSGRTATASATTYVENLHIFKTPSTQVQPISSGTTFTCNLENGAKSQFYITGASTINITNVRDGASFMIKTQTDGNYVMTWTATGGYTFVFEGGLKDPGNNVTDIFVFEVFGSVIYGNRRHNYS